MEMELDEQETPQRLKTHKLIINYQQKSQQRSSISPGHNQYKKKATPKNYKSIRKSINPRTPKTQSVSYSVTACSSLMSANNSMHSISMAVVQTPPAKRHQKIKNPFEAALAERLHLPLIASPSLFQRPNTPQLSSTQFEWTIDEVSSLKPANVEPHETQFQDSPDPELEAKAQSAISSYFKENQIVPSPIDCPLRSHRIILSEINSNTPLSKPGRRIRDCISQTELTLPPILPPALEEALKPYFQPHLAGVGKELKKSNCSVFCQTTSSETKDTSLRRKLFDMHNIIVVENENQQTPKQLKVKPANHSGHSNSSPISLNSLQHTAIVGKLSESMEKSSFGSLSPISASDSLSPNFHTGSGSKRKSRFGNFLNEMGEVELLSPINPPVRRRPLTETNRLEYRTQIKEISKNNLNVHNNNASNEGDDSERFTPERSSSPLNMMQHNNIGEFSTDSFNIKVSRLKVNSSKTQNSRKERINKSYFSNKSFNNDMDIFHDDTQDVLENTTDMDDMQISQLSGHSSNCSSSLSDTPRSKRRSASRKNLSQSFSSSWLQDEVDDDDFEITQSIKIKDILPKKQLTSSAVTTTTTSAPLDDNFTTQATMNTTPRKSLTFYRTDSGFNETTQFSLSSQENQVQTQQPKEARQMFPNMLQPHKDVMVCCSTPSKKDCFDSMI